MVGSFMLRLCRLFCLFFNANERMRTPHGPMDGVVSQVNGPHDAG